MIVHATTVVTNALIERKGARTAMVFTRGFPDILRIRDERRYDVYDPQIEFQRPLVAADDVFTLRERVLADGTVECDIDPAEVETLAKQLTDRSIQSVGICFLHSYKNDRNERHAAELLHRRLPSLFVSASSDVAPQIREYPRASTTVANAYAVPITQPYLKRLDQSLARQGFSSRPLIMLSSGGLVGPATAGRFPVRMIESGPAAGALAAAFAAHALGLKDLLAFDMGGTTAKVCLIQDHKPLVSGAFEIDRINRFKEGSGLPVSVPCIDMIEIGAGGGSIAQVNDMGLLTVGPRSAGSRPGPACYGLGGTDPTVTDADVVLGVIDAKNFLGGAMPLDADAAAAAVGRIARELGTTTHEAARGMFRVVCEAMAGAVRAHAADRGADYRNTPLLAFGGAGPVHACEVAELLNSHTVIFPPLASVLSAFGALVTPARLDLVHTSLALLDGLDWQKVGALFDDMEAEGRRALCEAGCRESSITFNYSADMRYLGQHFEILVDLGARPTAADACELLRRRYEEEYAKRYKLVQSDVAVEVVTWRVTAVGPRRRGPSPPRRSPLAGRRKSIRHAPFCAQQRRADPGPIHPRGARYHSGNPCGMERDARRLGLHHRDTEPLAETIVDGIQLELMWSNWRSVVTERAKAMQRSAFSPVVREAGDLAYAVFDARGRMVVQADTGTPGHINCLAFTGGFLARKFAGKLRPGDALITNDPWIGAGHFWDITVVAPIFRGDRIIAYVGSTNHHTDIGGLGVGVGAHDVHEEGLWIPPAKLYEEYRPNELLYEIIRSNVRTPEYISGDLAAQVSAAWTGGDAVNELCRRYGLDDIEGLADEIIARSETAMRKSIRACRSGTWTGETRFDISGGTVITLHAALTIDAERGEIMIDFAGSSPQAERGVNVVLNYTHAYSTFAIRSCLNPDLPNNAGSLAPIKVTAPLGSIVNCRYPAPVAARHVVGMYVPMPVLKVLYHVVPDKVLAEGPGAVWSAQIIGRYADGRPFTSSQFSFSGGMGARAQKPGPSATCYPTGISATPLEILESETPIVFRQRHLRPGSGGKGRSPGGDGQIVEFTVRTERPWTLQAAPTGVEFPAEGLGGGEPGAPGRFLTNGVDWKKYGKTAMQPGDVVYMETPGGGGFGPPHS